MKKWPGGDFDRKNDRNWVKIGPFGMKKIAVKAQRRGESIGPHFSGLKMSKNSEKWWKTDDETSKKMFTQIEKINIFIEKTIEIGSELVR